MSDVRVRTRQAGVGFPGGSYYQTLAGGAIVSDRSGPDHTVYSEEKMIDMVTEDYYRRLKEGKILPINPMTHTIPVAATSSNEPWLSHSKTSPSAVQRWTGFCPYTYGGSRDTLAIKAPSAFNSLLTPEAPSLAYMLQEARATCHGKPVDLLTMLAELDKSVDLVSNVHRRALERARKCIDAAAKIRKGDLNANWRRWSRARQVSDLLAVAGSIWLEYRFGWRLLVKDIEALKELYDRVGNTFTIGYERGTFEYVCDPTVALYRQRLNASGKAISNMSGTGWQRYDTREYLRRERTIRVGVMEAFNGQRMNFADPFVTAYELIPLSWMVDAFVNVGSAIKAWSPFISGRPIHQWMTDSHRTIIRREITYVGSAVGYVSDANPDQFAEIGIEVRNRYPVTLQAPVIALHPKSLSIEKWADIASVFLGFNKKLVRHAEYHLKRW